MIRAWLAAGVVAAGLSLTAAGCVPSDCRTGYDAASGLDYSVCGEGPGYHRVWVNAADLIGRVTTFYGPTVPWYQRSTVDYPHTHVFRGRGVDLFAAP